jgi:hypothetical protein
MALKLATTRPEAALTHQTNIDKYIGELHKLKQVFAYCLILAKKKSHLYQEMEKFEQYVPQPPTLAEDLENYLNEPIIFETIFNRYLRIYNVNIFTADLIRFLYSEHQ